MPSTFKWEFRVRQLTTSIQLAFRNKVACSSVNIFCQQQLISNWIFLADTRVSMFISFLFGKNIMKSCWKSQDRPYKRPVICLLIAAGSSAVFSACRGGTFIVIGGRLAQRLRCALGENRQGWKVGPNAEPFYHKKLLQIKKVSGFWTTLPKKTESSVFFGWFKWLEFFSSLNQKTFPKVIFKNSRNLELLLVPAPSPERNSESIDAGWKMGRGRCFLKRCQCKLGLRECPGDMCYLLCNFFK